MQLISRAIPGAGLLRPQPHIFQSEDGHTLVIATAWGSNSAPKIVFDKIKSVLAPQFFDPDATQFRVVPTELKVEKPMESNLADALRAANEEIYKADNEKTLRTVIEVIVLHNDGEVLYWAQAGQPHILISFDSTGNEPAEFVCVSSDPSAIFNQQVPLPMMGLGLDQFPNVSAGSVPVKKGVNLALLAVPGKALPSLSQTRFNVDDLSNAFSSMFPRQPGWVGTVEI